MTEPEDVRRMLDQYTGMPSSMSHREAVIASGVDQWRLVVENDHVEAKPAKWPPFTNGVICGLVICSAALFAIAGALYAGWVP